MLRHLLKAISYKGFIRFLDVLMYMALIGLCNMQT